MKDQITYDSASDTLTFHIEELPEDTMKVITSQPIKFVLDVTLHLYTGALLEFDIRGLKDGFDGEIPEGIEYDPDTDTLYLHLHPDDNSDGMCDMAYHDVDKNVLVMLNRSNVGNLTGIEIVGIETLLETVIDI